MFPGAQRIFPAALCLLAAAPLRAGSSPQDQARFLAGLPISPASPLAVLQKSDDYLAHREQLSEKWDYGRKVRWEPMQSWGREHLNHALARGVVRYLFGAPDFLGAHAFFPKTATLVLGGLEDPTLTREERMRQLCDIWKKQLAVMGTTSA